MIEGTIAKISGRYLYLEEEAAEDPKKKGAKAKASKAGEEAEGKEEAPPPPIEVETSVVVTLNGQPSTLSGLKKGDGVQLLGLKPGKPGAKLHTILATGKRE